ncbi:hypothetical protein OC845_002490 [Tilletia horrida]|nr:hypothetical protein OC845_002490 [Tilletia horrida]
MKYLDYPQFVELSRALSFTSSECTVFTRIEAYSCKPVAQEKRLYKHIQRVYAPEVAARKYGYKLSSSHDDDLHDEDDDDEQEDGKHHEHHDQNYPRSAPPTRVSSLTIPPHLAESPFGNLTESSTARKLLFTVIATLNAAFPDHDFADIPVSTFRREPSPAYVVHSLSTTLQSLRRNAAGNNPDAPAAAAATSPPTATSTAGDFSTAFLSAAPRTFAGLPASFDLSPSLVTTSSTTSRGLTSPSIAATLSPSGQMAQLNLSGPSFLSSSLGSSSHAGANNSANQLPSALPAMSLPPAVSNAQGATFPSSNRRNRVSSDASSQAGQQPANASLSRSPVSPRIQATSPRIGQTGAGPSSFNSPAGGFHAPAAITAATHPALASILDDIMCVEECEVYSFHPDIEYDPHASADDDEEHLLLGAGENVRGGLGLFEDGDEGGIAISQAGRAKASEGGSSALSVHVGRTRHKPKGLHAEGVYSYEHDDLEDIAEQWGEDDDDLADPIRPETMARAQQNREKVLQAGRRAAASGASDVNSGSSRQKDADGDEDMGGNDDRRRHPHHEGEGEDALLFDEDVYGQGLSGTQTPRAAPSSGGPATPGRPDLVSDTSSSSMFSSSSSHLETDGDTSMGDDSRGSRFSSPSKAKVLGPADPLARNAWGRVQSSDSSRTVHPDAVAYQSGRASYKRNADENDEGDDLIDQDRYSDGSDRSATEMEAVDEDEDDTAGLLWATYAFFYNKRLKRVLFVNVWARTNAGVEAHAAAAAAAAQARERIRMSTSPPSRGGWSAGGASSSWPGLGGTVSAGAVPIVAPAQRAISGGAQRSRAGSGSGLGKTTIKALGLRSSARKGHARSDR